MAKSSSSKVPAKSAGKTSGIPENAHDALNLIKLSEDEKKKRMKEKMVRIAPERTNCPRSSMKGCSGSPH